MRCASSRGRSAGCVAMGQTRRVGDVGGHLDPHYKAWLAGLAREFPSERNPRRTGPAVDGCPSVRGEGRVVNGDRPPDQPRAATAADPAVKGPYNATRLIRDSGV